MTRLKFLLERSSVYSKFLTEKLDTLHKEKRVAAGLATPTTTPTATPSKRAKKSTPKAKVDKVSYYFNSRFKFQSYRMQLFQVSPSF